MLSSWIKAKTSKRKNSKKRRAEIKERDHFVTVGGSNIIRLKSERGESSKSRLLFVAGRVIDVYLSPPITPVSHTLQQKYHQDPSFPDTTTCFYFRELSSSGVSPPFKWKWDICRDEVQLVLWQNECCSSHLGVSSSKRRSRQRGENERKQGGKQNESEMPEMKDRLKRLYPADCSGGRHTVGTDGLSPRRRLENHRHLPKTSTNASWILHLSNF